jgi:predicted nucleotidyltransferase
MALPDVRREWPIPLSSFLSLEVRLAALTGLRVDLVTVPALKPYIGQRIRAEANLLRQRRATIAIF